jgi:hypothetical protein
MPTTTSTPTPVPPVLTGFSASAITVTLGTWVTLTATTYKNVKSAGWWIDIVDEHNSVLVASNSGTSLTE